MAKQRVEHEHAASTQADWLCEVLEVEIAQSRGEEDSEHALRLQRRVGVPVARLGSWPSIQDREPAHRALWVP